MRDIVHDTFPQAQAAIRARLEDIWATTAARDFEKLESFHLYGPKFTAFKEGKHRIDAHACAAGERAFFSMIEGPTVDMKDLAINVFGDVAIATFNGVFTAKNGPGTIQQQATLVFALADGDWKIVHEHFSMIGGGPPMPPKS